MKDLGSKTKIGILYTSGARFAGIALHFVNIVFLARLLTPEDFGMAATGMLVIGFATKFGEFGFNMGLIQRNAEVTDTHVNTLFTMDLSFKIALWLIILVSTTFIAHFFDGVNYNDLVASLPIISFYMVLECFSTTPMAMMQRNMDFKKRSIILMSEGVITTINAIIMAFSGWGFWSLIYSKLIGIMIVGVWAAFMTKWVPKIKWDREAAKELFSFGFMVFLRNLFRYGADNAANFAVLKVLGGGALGIYDKAFGLMRLPQKHLTKGMNSVVFAAVSRIQDEPERVRQAFRKVILAVGLISFPILAGMAVIAPYLVPILLGDQWLDTIAPLQIMCISGILLTIDPFITSVLTGMGLVKFTAARRGLEFVLMGIAAFVGVQFGLSGVAIAALVVAFIIMLTMITLITNNSKITWFDCFEPLWPATAMTLVMLAAMILFQYGFIFFYPLPDLVMLLVLTFVGGITYIGSYFLFRFQLAQDLIQELSKDSQKATRILKEKTQKIRKRIFPVSRKKTAIG
ncbi:MAG: lipopolysaccharide biosynthesis protein [Deferribacteres bacterium]|nr:lipopolysaccharide biosynthesis protein [candidate division KSB1 bacterium]MCB9504122.1 lipopolysaccharide biosynthesis protein [Deferribacteres bacterium]